MRLAIVSREFPPVTEYTGGIGRQYARLAPELARQGHEVHVVTIADGSSAYQMLDGVHVHSIREARPSGPMRESRGMVGRAIQVDRVLRAAGPFEVVYGAEWRGELVRHALARRRAAVVTNLATSLAKVHHINANGDSRRASLRSVVQRALERRQAEQSEAIVAPSTAMLDFARDIWDIAHIPSHVLPNMIDVRLTRRLAQGEPPAGYPERGPTVAFFGRLEPVKGVDVLARAMRRLWSRGGKPQLVLIGRDTNWGGGDSMRRRLERIAAPFEDRITFIDNQPSERLFPAVAAADVVALPSRWESFSLAALESMALGRATVVSGVGGVTDFVQHRENGLVVAPEDDQALAAAIEELLGDAPLRERLGQNAARRADDFDVTPVARAHADCFAQIVTTSASRR
jgi:glycosyltransferase involved in cell wall biosynthesis